MSCNGACAECGRLAALEARVDSLEKGFTARGVVEEALIGIADLEARVGADRSTIGRWTRAGKFPEPVTYAGNRRRWRVSDIQKWEAERAATRHVPLIRGVVARRLKIVEGAGDATGVR